MNAASEWKDVVTEAMKGAIFLAILERLYITRSNSWFEEHLGVCAARISSDLLQQTGRTACSDPRLLCRTHLPRPACADYYCIQSPLFGHATLNLVGQARVLWKHSKRISDD